MILLESLDKIVKSLKFILQPQVSMWSICSSYRTLHFEILKMKQIFRSNSYPQNFVDCCITMYLDKVFIKHPNVCVVPKKELVHVLPFLSKKSLEIKKWLQNAIDRTLPFCKSEVIFKSPSKIVNHFHFKDVLLKKTLLWHHL